MTEAAAATAPEPPLRRTLGPWTLWGLGVGYVISGEYFGWNLGLPAGGTYGMLAATLLVTLLYAAFVFSYAELACAIPRAGGAQAYAERALGPGLGFLTGACQLVEFLFAPPAIALAIGAYLGLYLPEASKTALAIAAYAVFTGLNVWGVRQAAVFELAIAAVAVVGLLVFVGATAPAFDWPRAVHEGLPHGWSGAVAAIPFALWLYLGIEGVANAAEEARHPQRDVSLGFGAALATLVVLALAVFFCAVGVEGWRAIVYSHPGADPSDAPLPLAMGRVVPAGSLAYDVVAWVGLCGLVASFNGLLLAAGRVSLEFGRAGFGPRWLGHVDPRTGTPALALVFNGVMGVAALLTGQTGELIVISAFGALCLYVLSMVALFALRRREPDLARPFRAVGYPVVPWVALALSVFCLGALAWQHPVLGAVFAGLIAAAMAVRGLLRQNLRRKGNCTGT